MLSLFLLIYEDKVVVPLVLKIPFLRESLKGYSLVEGKGKEKLMEYLEFLDENKENELEYLREYQNSVKIAYNNMIKFNVLQVSDLVLR